MDDLLHFDHRKMAGRRRPGRVRRRAAASRTTTPTSASTTSWCRMTGPVVGQLQTRVPGRAARYQGGVLPIRRRRARPTCSPPADAGPMAMVRGRRSCGNVPGDRPPPDQRRDRAGRSRPAHRADRHRQPVHHEPGDPRSACWPPPSAACAVRIVAPGQAHAAATRRRPSGTTIGASWTRAYEILLHPADGPRQGAAHRSTGCFIGGCNLDDLSLFRNNELDLLFEDDAVAGRSSRPRSSTPLIAMSVPATVADVGPRPGLEFAAWIASRGSSDRGRAFEPAAAARSRVVLQAAVRDALGVAAHAGRAREADRARPSSSRAVALWLTTEIMPGITLKRPAHARPGGRRPGPMEAPRQAPHPGLPGGHLDHRRDRRHPDPAGPLVPVRRMAGAGVRGPMAAPAFFGSIVYASSRWSSRPSSGSAARSLLGALVAQLAAAGRTPSGPTSRAWSSSRSTGSRGPSWPTRSERGACQPRGWISGRR